MNPAIMLADGTLGRLGVTLGEDDVREIRNQAARGVDHQELARRFGVSQRYVADVLANRRHVDPNYEPGLPVEGGTIVRGLRHRQAAGDFRIDPVFLCWIWIRLLLNGLPKTYYKGNNRSAARAYYEIAYGPLDKDMRVVRTCNNGLCVSPRHGAVRHRADIRRGVRPHVEREATERGRRLREEFLAEAAPVLEQARRESVVALARHNQLWLARPLDSSFGDAPAAGDASGAVGGGRALDPVEVVAAGELRAILGDHDEDSIAALSESERLAMIERLYAGGFVDQTAMAVMA